MRSRLMFASVLVAAVLSMPAAAGALPSIPSSVFEPSAGCGCHAAFLEQWRPSMHAQALTDPLYLLKLKEAEEATGDALGPFCNACHGPIAVMAGELTSLDQSAVSPAGMEGVSCSFCHAVTGTNEPIGNTSAIVADDGIRRAGIQDPQAPHPAEYSEFHKTAEFCGTCHNVNHPGNNMHLEATYTEWKEGPYAAEGIVCQDCHMTPGPGVTKPNPGKVAAMGPDREHIYMMTFAGANAGLGYADLAEERLQAAATLELDMPEIVESGDVALQTTITNVGAGHYLPTGLTEVRQMWLEVTATDASGSELLSERRDFVSVLKDADGNSPVDLWDAADFESDDRIPPRESTSNEYSFAMSEGPVTVTAALYYRSCSEEMAAKAGVEIPTTTMATVTKTVYASAEQQAEGPVVTGEPDAEEEEEGEDDTGSPLTLYGLIALGVAVVAAAAFLMMRRGGR